jgi:signal transduction histidine kinase
VLEEEEHRRDTQRLNHLARYNAMGDMAMAIAHEVSQPIAAAYNFVEGSVDGFSRSTPGPMPTPIPSSGDWTTPNDRSNGRAGSSTACGSTSADWNMPTS